MPHPGRNHPGGGVGGGAGSGDGVVEPVVGEEALLRAQEHALALGRILQHVRQELQMAYEEKAELVTLLSHHLHGDADPKQQEVLDAQTRALDDRSSAIEETEKDLFFCENDL